MISYGKQSIDQDDIDQIIKVLKSDNLTQGPAVNKFEDSLGRYFNARYACAVSSGTAALHLVSKALEWGHKDLVITTPLSFLATANCIEYSGAKTVFADIEQSTGNIDPNAIEHKLKKLNKFKKKVKAIIAVDYAGHPCDWKSIKYLSEKYYVKLINDNCHAIGAAYLGKKSYASSYADIVTQSYHPVKNITTAEGGSVLTNEKKIYDKVKLLRSHGIVRKNEKNNNWSPWYYEMQQLGFNYRITDLQCALGYSQLKKLNKFIKIRRKIAQRYNQAFHGLENVFIPFEKNEATHAYHLYPLQIDFKKYKISKESFFELLLKKKINLQVHYIPIHLQPYFKKKYKFKNGDFPNSESFYKKEVSLPIYPGLGFKDQNTVIRSLLKILNV